jgi:hypothetical protein
MPRSAARLALRRALVVQIRRPAYAGPCETHLPIGQLRLGPGLWPPHSNTTALRGGRSGRPSVKSAVCLWAGRKAAEHSNMLPLSVVFRNHRDRVMTLQYAAAGVSNSSAICCNFRGPELARMRRGAMSALAPLFMACATPRVERGAMRRGLIAGFRPSYDDLGRARCTPTDPSARARSTN